MIPAAASHMTEPHVNTRKISAILAELAASAAGERVALRDMVEAFGDRAFGIVLLTFSLPNAVGLGVIPGLSAVFGLPQIFVAAQMASGLHKLWLPRWLLERSVAHAKDRVAFGRPIGGFQAVQHNLARLAGETAAALAAAGSAADAIDRAPRFDDAVFLEVASAKIRVGEAAETGAAIAHQVHGAIGFSREHVLHRYTQRLWAWRDDFGSESAWAVRLGAAVAENGADALWPALAAR